MAVLTTVAWRPRQRADADRLVGVRVDLLGEHAALQRVRRRPLEDRQRELQLRGGLWRG